MSFDDDDDDKVRVRVWVRVRVLVGTNGPAFDDPGFDN